MTEQERAERLTKSAPPMTERELEAVNGIFPAYIFRCRKTRELWTTCCGKHAVVPKREWSEAEDAVLSAEHTPAPRLERAWDPPITRPDPVPCPYCGKPAEVKELGRTGGRKNLYCYRRAVVLRQYRGALWAKAYDCWKRYTPERSLTERPERTCLGVYRFAPGKAESAARSWWSGPPWRFGQQTAPPEHGKWSIHDPYGFCAELGVGYDAVCLEELDKSAFRYCRCADYERRNLDFLEFLTACCFYPRQIEMLMKAGMQDVVRDLVSRGVKNAAAFSWNETDPRKAFGLTADELKTFLSDCVAKDGSMMELACYKRLRKAGIPAAFQELRALRADLPDDKTLEQITVRLRAYGLKPDRLLRYLERESVAEKDSKPVDMRTMLREWMDYITAAEILKLDLHNPIFLTPKGLRKKHDKVTKEAEAFQAVLGSTSYKQKRLPGLVRRYTYSDDRWLIRPPLSAGEITAEGKALKHCVGGYADRHVKGAVTILFLRDRRKPGKPYVTIEMSGNTIQQIHGYDDDRGTHVNQRTARADILEPWLAWLEGGSKRDRNKRPRAAAKPKAAGAA